MNERKDNSIIHNIVERGRNLLSNIPTYAQGLDRGKTILLEPFLYVRGMYWGIKQEVGPQKAKTYAMRLASGFLIPPDVLSLGIILNKPLLIVVGSLMTAVEITSVLATWVFGRTDPLDPLGIKEGIEIGKGISRQPRLFPNP